jgi:hypothetical protein
MDAKLSNKLMTMGNLMGLDGLFWDTREVRELAVLL